MDDKPPVKQERTTIDGVAVDVVEAGRGKTLLFLHSVDGVRTDQPFFAALADNFRVVAPWHPGFGHSELPREFRSVGDLAFFYLQLIDELRIADAVLVGTSFGGWLAAEIAIRSTRAFSHLVLVDPVGIKVGGREDRDIADVFALSQVEMNRLVYANPENRRRDYSAMTDRERLAIARSREAYTYFGWQPYMHNPTLRRWLRRIDIPTQVIWGDSDGMVSTDYGRQYADEIPGATFSLIAGAGHYPHLEQPAAFVSRVLNFVNGQKAEVSV